MSTRLASILLVCALPLAACVAATPASRLSLEGGDLVAAVPAGFCIDRAHSTFAEGGGVVLAGRCKASAPAPAILTITIGQPGSSSALQAGAKALSDWFLSPQGRAAVARDGQAASVQVTQTVLSEGAFFLRLTDRTVGEHWRALLGVKGRLITISAFAPDKEKLAESDSRKIVEQAISALRAAN